MASILKVRDADGTVHEIYALQGKSAYQYAVEGGYTGTEEEFAAKLADMPISFKPAGKSYLTFSSPSSFTLVVNDAIKHWDGTLEYFSSDKTWTVWDGTTTLSAIADDGEYVLYMRGTGNTVITGNSNQYRWKLTGSDIFCIGNIENLLDYATVESGAHPTMATHCYNSMFHGCSALTQAPALPATTLMIGCYQSMFYGCTSLTQAPALPATELASNCYSYMFFGCTSLIKAPTLPAITLAVKCYYGMFCGCTSLVQAPSLPATTLEVNCYYGMFQDCSALTQAPTLPATTLASDCYEYMFYGCTGLTQVPELPATTLANYCYYGMFSGCTSLKLSSTQTGEYTQEYRIPSSGDGVAATDALADMFTSTGGTFTGTPDINTTYYLSSDNMIVRETEIDTLNGYVGSMIDVAIAEHTSNPLNIAGATVGQIAKITAVDDTGKPTAWEAADMPSGGGVAGKTALDAFIDNTDIDHLFDGTTGAYYTVIRVYKQKLDGSYQYPFVYAPNGAGAGDKSTYDMTVTDGWLLAINSGIFNVSTKKPDGIVIQNGVVVQNLPSATHSQCKPLTIDNNGDLGFAAYDADAKGLVDSGIVSAVCGFMPIVVNYAAVDSSEWNSVSHYTENAQRQIIGQWGNGDYAIVTCEGRSYHNSDGWTIAEAQDICIKHGLKFAYNLDGGGSTETMLGKKHINTIYQNATGRVVPTFIVFNGTTVPPTTGDSGGGEETQKTLDSIAATYSGGDVAVGTDVTALTGIVVTATYSDGSTEAVTGYTLSGAIAEGSNTITVSYGGKTTTFTVNGVADSGFEPVTANATFLVHYNNVVNNNGISGNTAYSWHLNNINSRIAAVTSEPNIDGQQTETVNNINYYPIPIPSGATKVIITCPGFIPGDRYYSYDANNRVYTSLFDPGWQVEGGGTRELGAKYEYMTVNFKEVVESGYIPDGTDTSGFSIVFE